MRKLFVPLAFMLGLASCQQAFNDLKVDGEIDFQLSVDAHHIYDTRTDDGDKQYGHDSAFGAIDYLCNEDDKFRVDWNDIDLRYSLEIYDADVDYTSNDVHPIKDRQVIIVDKYEPVLFELRLVPGREYRFVVFADFVENGQYLVAEDKNYSSIENQRELGKHHVIGNDLRDISIKNDAINSECTDAYFATKDITITNSTTQNMILERPYSKIRVVATDLHELNIDIEPMSVKVTYTAPHPSAFNAVTGDITAEYSEVVYTNVYNDIKKTDMNNHIYTGYNTTDYKMINANGDVRNTHITLFTDYILANTQQESIHFSMEVFDQDNNLIKETLFNTDIPLQRNFLTSIIGNVLTTATEINVTIDDNFNVKHEINTDNDQDLEKNKPAKNEIWYKSTDDQIVIPSNNNAFNATIVSNTYENGKGIITFDDDITFIGNGAFYGCSSLKNIIISDSTTSIGNYSFYHCTSLSNITIPNSITEIGSAAFWRCSSLTNVNIGNGVTSIGSSAFSDCTNLSTVTIGNSVAFIGDDAFGGCTGELIINSKTFIETDKPQNGSLSWISTSNFSSIVIGSNITRIGNWTFDNCMSITRVSFLGDISSIGKYSFFNCASLKKITIPNSVNYIEECAFEFCNSLESVIIPESIAFIGQGAFYGCKSLEKIYCKAITPPSGDYYMFDSNASGRKIYVPMESVEAYKSAAYWSDYADYIFEEAETKPANNEIWYTSSDGSIITPNESNAFGANIVSNTYENGQGVILFDAPVTSIGEGVFKWCDSLTSVTIPDSVTLIGSYAFGYCRSLTSVTIGNSVTSIGEYAFSYCESLTSITIPDSVTSIRYCAFRGCTSLKAFYGKFASADNRCLIIDDYLNSFAIGCGATEYTIPDSVTQIGVSAFGHCTLLTSVIIPNSVTQIGSSAFYKCTSLTSVTIPDSVTSIGSHALYDCDSLTSVTIPDSVTLIGSNAFYECTSLTEVYCKATTPPIGNLYMFPSNASNSKIYVPTSSVNAYKSAANWSEYASDIVGYDFTE